MYLDRIIAHKKTEIRKNRKAYEGLLERPGRGGRTRDFLASVSAKGLNVIGEIKRYSPSSPVPIKNFSPYSIARAYREKGVSAISVLADQKYFGGSYENISIARKASGLPLLCKEFIIDRIQVRLARFYGADAVLLIARILSEKKLKELLALARLLGMRGLVEIHDEKDAGKAVKCGAEIIGINNRDLDTLEINLGVTERLAEKLPSGPVKISESGIRTPEDLKRVSRCGVNAVLIGEGFLRNNGFLQKISGLRSCLVQP